MAARRSEDGPNKRTARKSHDSVDAAKTSRRATPTGGPTGRELAEPHKEPQEHGGALLRHSPGSNGGVHRGPDLKPRHIFRTIVLKALTDVGEIPGPEKRSGAAKRKRARVIHAGVVNAAKGMQNILLAAAYGNTDAYGPFLRLIHDAHEMLQPPENGKNGHANGNGGPIMPRFSPPQGSLPTPAVEAAAEPEVRGVVKDGELYEEAE